jgi:dolichol kinase
MMLFLTFYGILVGYLFGKIWHLVTCEFLGLDGKQKRRGYHIHHSLFFIIPLLLIPFFWREPKYMVFLFSVSLGIIIEHRLTYKGFYFLERIKKETKKR